MADNNKKSSGGISSFLYRGALMAPIGIGAKATFRNYRAANQSATTLASNQPIVSATNSAIRSLASTHASLSAHNYPGLVPWQVSRFESLADTVAGLSKEDILSLWNTAAESAGLSSTAKQAILERISEAATPAEVFQNLQFAIGTGSTSVYAQRATSIFLQNVSAFEKQAAAGGITTPTDLGISGNKFRKVAGLRKDHLQLTSLDPILQRELTGLQEGLGGASMQLDMLHRKGLRGSQLQVKLFGGMLPEKAPMTLNIPMPLAENPNVIVHGAHQQSTYIAGQYAVVGADRTVKETYNSAQWAAFRANKDLVSALKELQRRNGGRLTPGTVRSVLGDFNAALAAHREHVPSVPKDTHLGIDLYTQERSNILRLFPEGGASYRQGRGFRPHRIDLMDYADIIEHGLETPTGHLTVFPGDSPNQIGHGVVSLKDPRGGLFAKFEPISRRPKQSLRRASITEASLRAIEEDPFNRRFSWAARWNDRTPAPMVRTAYISERYAQELSDIGIGTQGMSMISTSQDAFRGVSTVRERVINSDTGVYGASEFLTPGQAVWDDLNHELTEGTVLGIGPDGRSVVAGRNQKVLSAVAFQDKSRGNIIKMLIEEQIDAPQTAKYFGAGKTIQERVERSVINRSMSKFGTDLAVDAIIAAGDIKKNKGLFYNQLFTALYHFSHNNMNSGMKMGEKTSRFLASPQEHIEDLLKQAARSGREEDYIVNEALALARGGGFKPEQMGWTFGAVPDVLGLETGSAEALQESWLKKYSGAVITQAEAKEINKGVAFGVGQFFYEDSVGPGAGNVGSIEPRLYEMLGSPHFGGAGPVLQAEMVGRVLHERGYRLLEQETLASTAMSLRKPGKLSGAISPEDITTEAWGSGFNLHINDFGDIKVPAEAEMSQLAQYKTPAGKWVSPDLGTGFRDLAETARLYGRGELSRDVMARKLDEMAQQTGRAAIATVGGKGGLLRGSLPGSMQLTAKRAVTDEERALLPRPGDTGVSMESLESMVRDLEDIHGPEEMAAIREQMYKQVKGPGGKMMTVPNIGGRISGATIRHPILGPGSFATGDLVIMGQKGPYATYNEQERRALLSTSKGTEAVDAFRLGNLPGQAGDFDADNVLATVLSPNTAKEVAKHQRIAAGEMDIYSARLQLLKTKAAKGEALSELAAMADDSLKLGAVREHIGPTSVALQKGKAGILAIQEQLGTRATMDALQLAELLEQLPITSKHVAPGEAAKTIDMLQGIKSAIDTRQGGQMRAAIDELFRNTSPARRELFGEGAMLSVDMPGGASREIAIPGLNVQEAIGNMMKGIEHLDKTGADTGLSLLRERELIKSKSANMLPEASEVEALFSKGRPDRGVFSAFINPVAERGGMAKLVSKSTALKNRAIALGEKILPHAKPLALGFAASLAIASFLSAPKMSLEPPMNPQPKLGSGSGGQDLPTNIHPDSHVSGAPSAPPPIPPGHAFIHGPGSGMIVQTRGRSPGGSAYGRMNYGMSRGMGGGGSVRSSINDNRSSLTPQKLSDILRSGR